MSVSLAVGCGSKPVPVQPPEVPGEPVAQATAVEVGEADAGPLELALGQELIMRLESNPTTGYSWTAVAVEAPVLTPIDTTYAADPVPAGVVGGGGTEVLRFTATAAGTQALTLRYARPWETDVAPAKEVVFTVTVK